MKHLALFGALLLLASPALADEKYRSGVFVKEKYKMTFHPYRNTEYKYSVSVIKSTSVKDENGDIVPSTFDIDCETGEVDTFILAMGRGLSHAYIDDVLDYYLFELCTRNGYQGYSHKQ
ncbi:hypothetical protein MITS9509_01084 [Synechococcus sp. MIT S9509]|uniref:hypothetical protein n=1 Tax=unclassified Synechococcus TaxID=2626047 RepID=UPI0007BB4975|nr:MULTISPECIES: hypothetical protein [unclassified Synechococcus]KZR87233.1 hypothetical protein MITS9504_00649 [Synechococcus sp. MIT S9504]KZR92635.1 hypothetical protein MITS9509_01084 [Synechococcus sp. MIT S9509]